MPEHPATDDGGQVHLVREAFAVLFIGQQIDRQRQPRQNLPQHSVRHCVGHVDQVARGNDQVRHRVQTDDALHTALQARGRIDDAVGQRAPRHHVQIADLA